MGKVLVLAAALAALLASCSIEVPAAATDLDPAGLWKARLDRDVKPGSSSTVVENYLRENGVVEVSHLNDGKTLLGVQPIKIERIFPPIDTNSIRIECSFHPTKGLEACSVYQSSATCCGQ
ncbi:hypothetical protein GCM10011521_14800 [Arenimonas soli]|uniref:Uncharacterized protein n=1 Tax=Arenimonas soli TaxID=2269504 RepID=A0ABQ1HH64_9GAMM|nr:hypothetical protein GCM10011521_14800 [Arenimonas soli]